MSRTKDTRTDYTPEEVLALHRPLSWIIAAEHASHYMPIEDIQQECMIHLWKIALSRPGEPLYGLASVSMRRRAKEVAIRRSPVFGEEGKRGRIMDPIKQDPDSTERMLEEHGEGVLQPEEEKRVGNPLAKLPKAMQDYLLDAIERGSAKNNVVRCFRIKFPEWESVTL